MTLQQIEEQRRRTLLTAVDARVGSYTVAEWKLIVAAINKANRSLANRNGDR